MWLEKEKNVRKCGKIYLIQSRKRKKDLGQNQGKFVYLYTEIPDNTLVLSMSCCQCLVATYEIH